MEKLVELPAGIMQREQDAEQALVEQAKTNSAAFGVLYERYVMYIYHYLRTRVETDEDARDLTQQVFLQAFDALPKYRARGIPFKAWLFQIASHLATDSYRHRRKQVTWDLLPEALSALSEQNPETLLIEHESLAKKISPSQEKIGEFTVPFHGDKTVIAVNQTAISHGDALTLEQVVITPTEIRFDDKSVLLDRGTILTPIELSIAGKSYDSHPFPASTDAYGWFGPLRNNNYVSFYDSLQDQTGTWTLTEWARVFTGTSIEDSHADTWTFTFTVSDSGKPKA